MGCAQRLVSDANKVYGFKQKEKKQVCEVVNVFFWFRFPYLFPNSFSYSFEGQGHPSQEVWTPGSREKKKEIITVVVCLASSSKFAFNTFLRDLWHAVIFGMGGRQGQRSTKSGTVGVRLP